MPENESVTNDDILAPRVQATPRQSTARDPRFQKFVVGIIDGKSMTQAALDAGYAESTARCAYRELMPNARALFGAMLQEKLPLAKQVALIADGMEAKHTEFFAHKGVVTDERTVKAWGPRHDFTRLALQTQGLLPEKLELTGEDGGPLQIQVAIANVDSGSFNGAG